MLKDYCGICEKKIIPNCIDPILFKSDYFHYDCCTWDKKPIEIKKNAKVNTKEEIQEWIKNAKAEIILKNQVVKI